MVAASISTSQILLNWQGQSAAAERMCADILRIDGFSEINPQLPLGGPDGGKDILCQKDGVTFVAACYFPTGPKTFSAIKSKFKSDLASSKQHQKDGIIFLTSQHLTPGNRVELEKIAGAEGKRALIFHQEYLRVCLDSPSGYGIRLQHLRVPLSIEEQFSYFASSEKRVEKSLSQLIAKNLSAVEKLSAKIDFYAKEQIDHVRHTTAAILDAVREGPESSSSEMLKAAARARIADSNGAPKSSISSNLSVALICYIHRLVVTTSPHLLGKLRQTQVSIGSPTNSEVHFYPPTWDKVPQLMAELSTDWNSSYQNICKSNRREVVAHIAKFFHNLLWIHPFVDGNGRVAREVARLQTRELLGIETDILLERGASYYGALQKADHGDFSALEALFLSAINEASS